MEDAVKYTLIAVAVLLVLHQISFRLLWNPTKYKEQVTLRAAHKAFKEEVDELPRDLKPFEYKFSWRHFLNMYQLVLHRDAPERFRELRSMWGVDEEEYKREVEGKWESFGSVGLSGSMFFHTTDRKVLFKSLGRKFENRFLHQHFLPEYFDYAKEHPNTLINKVYEVLCSFEHRFGEWIRVSPSHYIVIENISQGKDEGWEMYDLKPTGYLEPYRDLLPERVQISGVTDVLPIEKTIFMSPSERSSLLARFKTDLTFLAHLGCIDYSVLLVRLPDGSARFALIDVFWSLREPRAHITKRASDAAGLPQQTVTADAEGYAGEVMRMMERIVQVKEGFNAKEDVKKDAVLVDL